MMKKVITILINLLLVSLALQCISLTVSAQVPGNMAYQVTIIDENGELLINHKIGFRIHIKHGSQFGASVYVETHSPQTDNAGMIKLTIGNGTLIWGSIDSIDWANGPYYLYTETDLEGGTNYHLFSLSKLLSVPYSLYAKKAHKVEGGATIQEIDELIKQTEELQLLTGQWINDIDGNVYRTVKIGEQTWMAENLKATRYNNGDAIHALTNPGDWLITKTGAYGVYDNNPELEKIYGKLYNYFTVQDNRNICPVGWHISSMDDWSVLQSFLGADAGKKLKEKGTSHWGFPNEASNETGFTALPGGGFASQPNSSTFWGIKAYGYWWCTRISGFAYYMSMYSNYTFMSTNFSEKTDACSIRCVKD